MGLVFVDSLYCSRCSWFLFLGPCLIFFFLSLRLPPRSTPLPYTTLFLFFFNDTATTEIYTLSLHDALPICTSVPARSSISMPFQNTRPASRAKRPSSTRKRAVLPARIRPVKIGRAHV